MFETNKIYLGDCYKIINDIPDNSIDLIVTDPPYLIDNNYGGGCFGSKKRHYHKELKNLSKGVNIDLLKEFARILKKINIYIWCNKNQLQQYINFFVELDSSLDLLTWHKTNPTPTCNNKYLSDTEYCLFFREKGVPVYGTYETKRKYYITEINNADKQKWQHPTIKPLFIIKNLITNSSKRGELIFDPFSGSGTTALAASQLKRKYLAIEINEKYYDASLERLNIVASQLSLWGSNESF